MVFSIKDSLVKFKTLLNMEYTEKPNNLNMEYTEKPNNFFPFQHHFLS